MFWRSLQSIKIANYISYFWNLFSVYYFYVHSYNLYNIVLLRIILMQSHIWINDIKSSELDTLSYFHMMSLLVYFQIHRISFKIYSSNSSSPMKFQLYTIRITKIFLTYENTGRADTTRCNTNESCIWHCQRKSRMIYWIIL